MSTSDLHFHLPQATEQHELKPQHMYHTKPEMHTETATKMHEATSLDRIMFSTK